MRRMIVGMRGKDLGGTRRGAYGGGFTIRAFFSPHAVRIVPNASDSLEYCHNITSV